MVEFFEGILRSEEGLTTSVVWARSRFGNRIQVNKQIREIEASELERLLGQNLVTVVELDGLDSDDATFLVDAILRGRYCHRPGVRGKVDAALYLLVNEVLGELTRPDLE
ncbi:MAG: hypothetical protein V1897_13285 [Pseudomonadota bacterium]